MHLGTHTCNAYMHKHTRTHAEKLISDVDAVAAIDFFNVQMYNQIPFKSSDQVRELTLAIPGRIIPNQHTHWLNETTNRHLHAFPLRSTRHFTNYVCRKLLVHIEMKLTH